MTIAELRRESGLSQSKFAEHYGIPVRTLQQWEQGKSSPAPYVLSMMEKLKPTLREEGARKRDIKRFEIPERHHWKICIDRPFENCDRIYPTQQRKVRELLDDIEGSSDVERVVVFGSSVTQRCHLGSDVDMYVEKASSGSPINHLHNFEFDLWTNNDVDDRLMREIEETGVVVYGG